jgi:sugar-specific transcriptional regulator TrmB
MVVNMTEQSASAPNPAQLSLIEMGFSEYEAKAYLALLQDSPVSAYEVGKASGVPSSKIYQVLARLVERGIALAIEEGGKTSYVPLSPQELIESQRHRMESRLGELERQLTKPRRDERLNYIWNFSDYPGLQEQLGLLARDARRELILSIWREDSPIILPLLPVLRKRGVKIAIILYGLGEQSQLPPQFAAVESLASIYPHPIEDTLYQERGGRGLTAIADGTRALTATVFADQSVEGAWSLNRGFVLLAEDYIKHDIYLMKIVERMDERLTAIFGERYAALRDIFAK